MRRWLCHGFIISYLGFLAVGIVAHALKWGSSAHPAMYYAVWDMFCGWQAYESRYHVIAEGESGTVYELAPAPWGAFCPYGDLPRNHYDAYGHSVMGLARNALRHADHEPIARIMVVEECWNKKYNFPDHLWSLKYDEPKEPYSYFWLRMALTESGQILYARPDFPNYMYGVCVADNPRLVADTRKGQPFITVDYSQRQSPANAELWSQRDRSVWPSAH
jgi:hypothetical protein